MDIFNFFSKHKIIDLDEEVLVQLKKAGSNLSKPHHVEFFLYFNDEVAANNVKNIILKQHPDDHIDVEKSPDDKRFCCQIQRSMVPTLEKIQDERIRFEDLSAQFGGIYDSWGAGVEK